MCNAHWLRFRHRGTDDDLETWIATTDPGVRRQSASTCGYDGCGFPVRGLGRWCDFHARRWEKAGKPDPEEWLRACRGHGFPVFHFGGLPEPLRSELQYVLQTRGDESRSKLRPWAIHALAKIAVQRQVTTLRDLGAHDVVGSEARALLRWSTDRLDRLAADARPSRGFDDDVWNLRDMGFEPHESRGTVHVRFDLIPQTWLRDLTKRWLRSRVITGMAGGTVQNYARHITTFATWLNYRSERVDGLAHVDRRLLEEWMVEVHSRTGVSVTYRNACIGALRVLLEDSRRFGWAPDLPANAIVLRQDLVPEPDLLPRALPEHVIAQLETDEALARVDNALCELIIRVLIGTGLRISHVLRLPVTCLQTGPTGNWCLNVVDTKVRREHSLPLTEELAHRLRHQRESVRSRWPAGENLVLFPRPTGNPHGTRSYAYGTFRDRLQDWIERCDLRDEGRHPIKVTAHQFRHTIGTRMINNGVPQHVVQEWLNHRSSQMTAHYARIHHQTLRREWEAFRERVNIDGAVVVFDPSSPTNQAEWMNHNMHNAAETLPNGYCGRPLQRDCEVPNACLTCHDFLTDETFLVVHEEQQRTTAALIRSADERGHRRIAENNRKVLASLDNIVAGIRRLQTKPGGIGSAPN